MDLLAEFTSRELTKPIYHYTSAAGLIGIAQSSSIWATSHFHLNDSTEHQIALTFLDEALASSDLPAKQQVAFRLLLKESAVPFYITSFSENGDLLSQWRAYCEYGVGYSIGFSPQNPLFSPGRSNPFTLIKCLYKEIDQRRLARALVSTFDEQYWSTTPEDQPDIPSKFRAWVANSQWMHCLAVFISMCKHAGFEAEAEWRLVSRYPTRSRFLRDLKYRSGRFGLVSYFPIPLHTERKKMRFDFITIGPSANHEAAHWALISMIETHFAKEDHDGSKIEPPIVSLSNVPYRA